MPDRRRHRGPHPEDARLFSPEALGVLRRAVRDYAWLLTQGYAGPSSLKLVGDHFALEQRQRLALMRSTCSAAQRVGRGGNRVSCDGDLRGETVLLDGYNVLTTVEAALAGGLLLLGCDGCLRDLASVHGTWRRVDETVPAAQLIGKYLAGLGPTSCNWLLDRPVSNSGRLRMLLLEMAGAEGWPWTVEVVYSPDAVLARSEEIVATTDSAILDRCRRWVDLSQLVIRSVVSDAWIVDLSGCDDG